MSLLDLLSILYSPCAQYELGPLQLLFCLQLYRADNRRSVCSMRIQSPTGSKQVTHGSFMSRVGVDASRNLLTFFIFFIVGDSLIR